MPMKQLQKTVARPIIYGSGDSGSNVDKQRTRRRRNLQNLCNNFFFPAKQEPKTKNKTKNCITFLQLSSNNELEGDEICTFFQQKKNKL
jgi:hypothetical protein